MNIDTADLISRLRASIAGKESCEEATVFVANIAAAIQWLEAGAVTGATIDSDEFQSLTNRLIAGEINPARLELIAHIDARIAAAGMADRRDADRLNSLLRTVANDVRWACMKLYSHDDSATDWADKMVALELPPIIDAAMAAAEGEAKP